MSRAHLVFATAFLMTAAVLFDPVLAAATPKGPIKTVFVILMENHDWSEIQGNSLAPYINGQLLPKSSFAGNYFDSGVHPSLPNYLWLEAGDNFGITDDGPPSQNQQSTTNHLVTQLNNAGFSWKAYQEDISGADCPLQDTGQYAVKHDPFMYFVDVTGSGDPSSAYCIAHVRPYTELASDLQSNRVSNYNFITPNLCYDMHDCGVDIGDNWLASQVPMIMNSPAFQNGGALFITWDEGDTGDQVGLILLSSSAKGNGYSSGISYTHASLLRTVQEIFGVGPFLGAAGAATDLSDLFAVPLQSSGGGTQTTPSMTNAASYSMGSVSPGEIVSVFGTGIGPAAPAAFQLNSQGMVGTSLANTRVLFDGMPGPMLYAGPNQINAIAPYALQPGTTTHMQVEYQGRQSAPVALSVAPTTPGIFALDGSGKRQGAILNQDGSINSSNHPAARDSIVQVFATGAGETTPGGVDGKPVSGTPPKPLLPVSATIGGLAAEILFAGGAPMEVAGVLQVNVRVPAGVAPGAAPIVLTVGGSSSQSGITVAVQ